MIITDPGVLNPFLAEKAGIIFLPKAPYSVMGATDSRGKVIAALMFHTWSGRDIEITATGTRFSKELLRAAYGYVARQLGCTRATFKVNEHNHKSIHASVRLGAKLEGRLRDFYGEGRDALVYGIRKQDYKYGW